MVTTGTGELRALDTTGAAAASDEDESGYVVITGLTKDGRTRTPGDYIEAVSVAGGAVKILSTFRPPPSEETPRDVDLVADIDPADGSVLDSDAAGLVLTGGADVDPALYGARRHPKLRRVSRQRDRFELTLLGEALARDLPVLAICRGMQLLNVALGGTLEQHLADDPKRLDHDRERVRADYAHKVRVKEHSGLAAILEGDDVPVNSHHHQGLENVARPLEEVGWAEDGVLEAVVSREHSWIVGVQWHPEVLTWDPSQKRLVEAFVQASRAYRSAARRGRPEA